MTGEGDGKKSAGAAGSGRPLSSDGAAERGRSLSGASSRVEPFGSDLRLTAKAPTLAAAFAEAALALGCLLAAGPRRPEQDRALALKAPDRGALLVALLEEILFLFETEKLLPAELEIDLLTELELSGRLGMDRFDSSRHEPGHGVKAVTWHGLSLRESEEGAFLTVILDL